MAEDTAPMAKYRDMLQNIKTMPAMKGQLNSFTKHCTTRNLILKLNINGTIIFSSQEGREEGKEEWKEGQKEGGRQGKKEGKKKRRKGWGRKEGRERRTRKKEKEGGGRKEACKCD